MAAGAALASLTSPSPRDRGKASSLKSDQDFTWRLDAQEKLGKCLVVGGAGWLGSCLVRELLDLPDDLGVSAVS